MNRKILKPNMQADIACIMYRDDNRLGSYVCMSNSVLVQLRKKMSVVSKQDIFSSAMNLLCENLLLRGSSFKR
jgi:hypothetical protein